MGTIIHLLHWTKRRIYELLILVVTVLLFGHVVLAEDSASFYGKVKDSRSIVLQWKSDNVENVYQIYKSTGAENYILFATISGQIGTIKCFDFDVKLGKSYSYKLVELLGNEVISERKPIKIKMTLATPTGVKAKVVKDNRIQLSWKRVDKATTYTVYRSEKQKKGFKKLTTVKENAYVDYDVKKGTTYYYKVVANYKNKKSYTSGKSVAANVHVKVAAPQVDGVYVEKKIKLTWKKVAGADIYYIYKKNSKGEYNQIAKTSKLYYRDSKVKKDHTYTYQVIAACKVDGKIRKGKASSPCIVKAKSIDSSKKMVALTFDDGPNKYTKDIVKCLEQNQSKATFFVLGCNIDRYEDALLEADKIGCEIGNHSYSHTNLTKISQDEIVEEIYKTDSKVQAVTGKIPTLVRTPGGSVDEQVKKMVDKPIVLWSIDTRDWEHRSKEKTIRKVMDDIQDGDIVLMHDIYESTKEAACTLIVALRREGYQLVTVSELAEYRGDKLKKGEVYRNFRKRK